MGANCWAVKINGLHEFILAAYFFCIFVSCSFQEKQAGYIYITLRTIKVIWIHSWGMEGRCSFQDTEAKKHWQHTSCTSSCCKCRSSFISLWLLTELSVWLVIQFWTDIFKLWLTERTVGKTIGLFQRDWLYSKVKCSFTTTNTVSLLRVFQHYRVSVMLCCKLRCSCVVGNCLHGEKQDN